MISCFFVLTIVDPLTVGPVQTSPMPSLVIRPLWDSRVIFCSEMPYAKFNEVFLGGQNVRVSFTDSH